MAPCSRAGAIAAFHSIAKGRNTVQTLIAFFDRLIRGIVIAAIGGMLAIICLQIFCRFVLNDALSWPEEAARFLMVWSHFLAAVYALADKQHIGLFFVVDRLPPRVATVIRMVMNLAILGFLAVMVVGGWQEAHTLVSMKTGALRISRAIPYMIIPVSGVLFILVTIRLFLEDAAKLRSK